MKRIVLLATIFFTCLSLLLAAIPSQAYARSYRTRSSDVYIRGYYRKNGTYVKPYYRSKSDGLKFNNYSCLDYGRC